MIIFFKRSILILTALLIIHRVLQISRIQFLIVKFLFLNFKFRTTDYFHEYWKLFNFSNFLNIQ